MEEAFCTTQGNKIHGQIVDSRGDSSHERTTTDSTNQHNRFTSSPSVWPWDCPDPREPVGRHRVLSSFVFQQIDMDKICLDLYPAMKYLKVSYKFAPSFTPQSREPIGQREIKMRPKTPKST